MILEVSWDELHTLSFRLSQFHGHGSWLVCEVALKLGLKAPSLVGQDERSGPSHVPEERVFVPLVLVDIDLQSPPSSTSRFNSKIIPKMRRPTFLGTYVDPYSFIPN
jgi:hypothetical protein